MAVAKSPSIRAEPSRPLRVLLATGLLLGLTLPARSDNRAVAQRPIATPFTAQSGDSILVYGPVALIHEGSNTTIWELHVGGSFSADSLPGWRYVLELVNGSPRVTGATFSVNEREFLGTSEYGSTTVSARRRIDVAQGANTIGYSLRGVQGAYATVRIVRVQEPAFTVFGRKTYVRPTPIAAQLDTFHIPTDAGPPYTLWAINGDTVGSAHRLTNATMSVNGAQVMSSSDFGTGRATATKQVNLDAEFHNTVRVYNQSTSGTKATLWLTAMGTLKPQVALSTPTAETTYTAASALPVQGIVADRLNGRLTINDGPRLATPGSFSDSLALPSDGDYPLVVYARNSGGLDTTVARRIFRDTAPPVLTLTSPASDTVLAAGGEGTLVTVSGTWSDLTPCVVSIDGEPVGSGTTGAFTAQVPLDLGPNNFYVRARDALGHVAAIHRLVYLRPAEDAVTRDTSEVALGVSPIASTEATAFRNAIRFLYAGADPVQAGLDTSILLSGREAVVRGRVFARDFGDLPNARVSVLGQSRFGSTQTRVDGTFSLVVNGGAPLVLRVEKPGFLEAQRQIEAPVEDYTVLDDVALLGRSARTSAVNTANAQVVTGRLENDESGDRRLSLVFNAGTRCRITRQNGDTTSLTQFHVRTKEYTVGDDGDESMPAALPPTTAYTYCVNLSVDEAEAYAQGDSLPPDVQFDQPVLSYVKEFLGLPVGSLMPSGYYDPRLGAWVAAEDGRVIRLIRLDDGMASFDVDGDGLADSLAMAELGMTDAERTAVAGMFAVGDTVWRMPLRHFSPQDFNLNRAALADAGSRLPANASAAGRLLEKPRISCGCVIENENQVLGETIPIQGTPFALHYRSSRQPGDLAMRTLRIPLLGDSIPPDLRRIRLRVDVAGHRYSRDYEEGELRTNLTHLFDQWDGTDAYHRPVQGTATATIRIGFEYMPRLTVGSGGGDPPASGSFGDASTIPESGGLVPGGERFRVGRVVSSSQQVSLGAPSTAAAGLGGWTISPHHIYDTNGRGALWQGDGSFRYGYRQFPIIRVFAGSGLPATGGSPPVDGVIATTPSVSPQDMAFGPDGSLYYTDELFRRVFRIDRQRKVYVVAGTGQRGTTYAGDGVATSIPLNYPLGITVGRDGSVYFVDASLLRVFRVTPNGWMSCVAGTGSQQGARVEDTLATAWPLVEPVSVALGIDGSLFVSDRGNHRVLRVGTNGRIRTYAGTGQHGPPNSTAEGRAVTVALSEPWDLATDPAGNLFVAEYGNHAVRRIAPDGRLTTFASVPQPASVAFGPDGLLWVGENDGIKTVIRVEEDGSLSNIAGGFPAGGDFVANDGQFARGVTFASVRSLALDSRGAVYVGQISSLETRGCGISRISIEQPGASAGDLIFPSEDGREQYVFTSTGRHLRTEDAVTGVVRYRFGYDPQGRLTSITDAEGDLTRIHRNAAGWADSIIAPFGQVTTLAPDASGMFLGSVSNAAGESHRLTYQSGGLLDTYENPRGYSWTYTYEAATGRLATDTDPVAGGNALSADETDTTRTVTRTSAEGRTTTYAITQMLDGLRRRLVHTPERPANVSASEVDSMSTSAAALGEVDLVRGADGEVTVTRPRHDTRYSWLAPVPASVTTTLPVSGTTRTQTRTRTWPTDNVRSLVEVVTVAGHAYEASYDSVQDRLTLSSPEQRTSTVEFDPLGRPTRVTTGPLLSPVALGYDARGHLTHLSQAGRAWRYGYDALGRLESVTDTLGRETQYRYDAADRETLQTLPGGRVVRYRWDANGNLEGLTPPGRAEHGFAYTKVDLNERYTPPPVPGIADPASRYEFDRDRQLTRVVRPDGGEVRLHYGASTGRLDSLSQPRGSTAYSYAANTGQLATATSPDSVVSTYAYDGPLLLRESWSGAAVGAVGHEVNIAFADSTETVVVAGGDSSRVTYGYDDDGLLTGVAVNGASEAITRRASDGLIEGTSVGAVASAHSYNAHGELSNLRYTAGGSPLFEQTLTRDALGRIERIEERWNGGAALVHQYRYDAAGRLDSVAVGASHVAGYTYDDNGNRTAWRGATGADTASATIDAQDRLERYGSVRYEYTATGELKRKIVPVPPEQQGLPGGIPYTADTTTYTYDALGNLLEVRRWGEQVEYVIDGANRRVGRIANGTRTHTWLYRDGLGVIAELDGTGALRNRYVYGTLGHVPDLLVREGTTYRLITDQLGSVRAVVNAATGEVTQRIDYDAWGERTLDSAPGWQSLGYAGGLSDSATGLVRFGARDYDAGVGRWTSKDDASRLTSNSNLFAYVRNAPTCEHDATGEEGTEEECENIRRRILNLQRSLISDLRDYKANSQNLPESCPGPSRLSREGHRQLMREKQEALRRRLQFYFEHCGNRPPRVPGELRLLSPEIVRELETLTGLSGWYLLLYLAVSETSRVLFPPRNWVPVP